MNPHLMYYLSILCNNLLTSGGHHSGTFGLGAVELMLCRGPPTTTIAMVTIKMQY
jgi:hypothetical protein